VEVSPPQALKSRESPAPVQLLDQAHALPADEASVRLVSVVDVALAPQPVWMSAHLADPHLPLEVAAHLVAANFAPQPVEMAVHLVSAGHEFHLRNDAGHHPGVRHHHARVAEAQAAE